jgi:hypothetical protein
MIQFHKGTEYICQKIALPVDMHRRSQKTGDKFGSQFHIIAARQSILKCPQSLEENEGVIF